MTPWDTKELNTWANYVVGAVLCCCWERTWQMRVNTGQRKGLPLWSRQKTLCSIPIFCSALGAVWHQQLCGDPIGNSEWIDGCESEWREWYWWKLNVCICKGKKGRTRKWWSCWQWPEVIQRLVAGLLPMLVTFRTCQQHVTKSFCVRKITNNSEILDIFHKNGN